MAVAILGWLGQAPIYLIVLSVIAAIAFGFWGSNQITLFRQIHQRRINKYSDREIEALIHDWLDITGFTLKREDVDENNAYFLFTILDSCSRPVYITRQKNAPHYIRIYSGIGFNPKPDARRKLTLGEFNSLTQKLGLEMLRLGCSYEITPLENGFNISIENSVPIDDNLTRITFGEACAYITRSFTVVIRIIGLTLGEWGVGIEDLFETNSQA